MKESLDTHRPSHGRTSSLNGNMMTLWVQFARILTPSLPFSGEKMRAIREERVTWCRC
jgi:hypothetical protein